MRTYEKQNNIVDDEKFGSLANNNSIMMDAYDHLHIAFKVGV